MSNTTPQDTGIIEPDHQQNGLPFPNEQQLSTQSQAKSTNIAAPAPANQTPIAEKGMHAAENQTEKQLQAQQPAPAPSQQRNIYTHATPLGSLQEQPAPIDCPFCKVREMSRTEYHSGTTTYLSAALCCCCFCLGCIPFLATFLKDVQHSCVACGKPVAVWHRSGRTEVLG